MFRLALLAVVSVVLVPCAGFAAEKETEGPKLAHMVFFALKDHSTAARDKFVASCHQYLSKHEGTAYYSVGIIADDVVEPGVSVRDFDVALHLVFEDKAAEAKYLKDPRHLKFVEENRALFDKVRVFDSYLTKQP
jgi:Stress responsive A/B Barrel Domain